MCIWTYFGKLRRLDKCWNYYFPVIYPSSIAYEFSLKSVGPGSINSDFPYWLLSPDAAYLSSLLHPHTNSSHMTLSSPLSIHHKTFPMTDPTNPMLSALVILTWTKPILPSCLRFRHDKPKKLDLQRFTLQTFALYHDHFYPPYVCTTNAKACLMTIDPYFPLHIAASSAFLNFRHSKRKRKFSWLHFIEAFRPIKKTHPRTISLLSQVK